MTKVLSFRVSDEEAAWADEYAKGRGVSRQDLLASGFRSHRDDCERGVPDIGREAPKKAPRAAPVVPSLMAGRQARLAKEMGWSK